MRWGENAAKLQISFEQRALIDRLLEASLRRGFYKLRKEPGIVYGPCDFSDMPKKVRTINSR